MFHFKVYFNWYVIFDFIIERAVFMEIREMHEGELERALELTGRVFLEFEGPDYTAQGIEEFQKSIRDPEYLEKLRFYGAFENGELRGTLATREQGSHIALFFVEGKYQGCGIGKKLFERAKRDNTVEKMTVNASPYACEIYHRLGFVDSDREQIVNGIRFTPMTCYL